MSFDKLKLEGMTVNERLYETGQYDLFYAAVAARDMDRLRSILESIHVDEAAIQATLKNVIKWGTAHDPTWTPDRL